MAARKVRVGCLTAINADSRGCSVTTDECESSYLLSVDNRRVSDSKV